MVSGPGIAGKKSTPNEADQLWRQLHEVIDSYPSLELLIGEQKLESLKNRLEDLTKRLEKCAGPLHLGLVGGTGVGKSTLINAVASARISVTSDRRPQTDKIIVYRHADLKDDATFSDNFIQERHRVHHNQLLRDLIIYDLPDFDSIRPDHKALVCGFLVKLDVVLWLVSPEKYADRAFYDLLAASPQSRDNFVFIMNKIDLLVDEKGCFSPAKLSRVMENFKVRLQNHRVEQPRLMAISALTALDNTIESWNNGYNELRDYLEKERKDKEIRSIKLNNLQYEFRSLASQVGTHVQKEEISKVLGRLRVDLDKQWSDIEHFAVMTARESLRSHGINWLNDILLTKSAEAGPVYGVVRLKLAWRRFTGGEKRRESEIPHFTISAPASRSLEHKIDYIRNRIAGELSVFGVPIHSTVTDSNVEREQSEETLLAGDLTHEMDSIVKTALSTIKKRRFSFSRIKQSVFMLLPPGAMIVYLSGSMIPQTPVDTWEWSLLPKIVVGIVFSLFTPNGLAAICSMIILEMIMIPWLGNRSLKKLEAQAGTFLDLLADQYGKLVLDRIRNRKEALGGYLDTLRDALNKIESIERWGVDS